MLANLGVLGDCVFLVHSEYSFETDHSWIAPDGHLISDCWHLVKLYHDARPGGGGQGGGP